MEIRQTIIIGQYDDIININNLDRKYKYSTKTSERSRYLSAVYCK